MMKYGSFPEAARPAGEEEAEARRRARDAVRGRLALGLVGALAFATLLFLASSSTVAPGAGRSAFSAIAAQQQQQQLQQETLYSISASNKYGGQPQSVRDRVYPYALVMEPHRESTLYLVPSSSSSSSSDVQLQDDDIVVTWFVDDVQVGTGASTTFTCTVVKDLTVRAEVTRTLESEDGSTTTVPIATVTEDTAKCVYVRRELRALQDDDLETLLDALSQVYRLSKEDGVAKYGDSYKSIDDFMVKHLLGAGQKECDHWHDDAGVLTHHTAYTLEMEMNLQLIDPSISLAYWDYISDSRDSPDPDAFLASEVVSSKMFGPIDPENDLHTTTEGRWAYISVSDAPEDFKVQNAYGQLRTPWNMNPSPYLGRHSNVLGTREFEIPDCTIMDELVSATSLASFTVMAAGSFHGAVHVRIGGEWDSTGVDRDTSSYLPTLSEWLTDDDLSIATLVSDHTNSFKRLWRYGFTRCPDSCDVLASDSCVCSVPEEYFSSIGAAEILRTTRLSTTLGLSDEVLARFADELLEFYGTSQIMGEMGTSAAPLDPLFFVIHQSAERVLQYVLTLADRREIAFDETWGYIHTGAGTDDFTVYCDWSNVSDMQDSSQLPECAELDISCPGHNEFDEIDFPDILGAGTGKPTNAQFFQAMRASSGLLPYIYSDFDFSYCSTFGYDWGMPKTT